MTPVAVLGAGAWGTALAISFARAGCAVWLWGRDEAMLARMARARRNERYLASVPLPANVRPVASLGEIPRESITVLAVPLQATRALVRQARAFGFEHFACTAKGIESDTHQLVHEIVLGEVGPRPVAIVSGPTFAREVAEGRPTALAVAARPQAFGEQLVSALHAPTLRPYLSDDMVGVAVGGAVKNVLAIAAGIADGLALGANSRAALITRGLAEMARLGIALGGRAETFMGLAGLGDLVLTCTDDQSRNRRFGLALGRGRARAEAERELGVVEGIATAAAVLARATAVRVEMPIVEQVVRTLSGECTPPEAVRALMSRELSLTPTGQTVA